MKNAVSWDVTPGGSCKNRRFGGTYDLPHQGDKNLRARNNINWPILVTLMIEGIHFFETSFLTRATQRNIPENGIHQNKCCLKRLQKAKYMLVTNKILNDRLL
jgi:hypothetical protein